MPERSCDPGVAGRAREAFGDAVGLSIAISFGPPVSSPSSAGGITPRMNPMLGM
jgi:hypothetical protein